MSKKKYEHFFDNFTNFSIPLEWDYFVKIIKKEYGAVEEKRSHSGGSKRTYSIGDMTFSVHEPHGRERYLSKWDRKKVITLFRQRGLIDDAKEED